MEKHYASELLTAVANNLGIQKIIDIGYRYLENPILVGDASLKILGYKCGSKALIDPVWCNAMESGYISLEIMNRCILPLRVSQGYDKMATPILINQGPYAKTIVGRIASKGVETATIAVWQNEREFVTEDIEVVEQLMNAISAELQKKKYRNGMLEEHMYFNFLNDLLKGVLADPVAVENRLKILKLHLKEYYTLLAFDTLGVPMLIVSNLREALDSLFAFGKAIVYKDRIILILSHGTRKLPSGEIKANISKVMHTVLPKSDAVLNRRIYVGISDTFDDLTQIRKYYSQAVIATEIGQDCHLESEFVLYTDHLIEHMLKLCGESVDLRDFYHPAFVKILQYDALYDTSYAKSIYEYLYASMDIQRTAQVLNVHRNTVKYRIDKFQEITQADITDTRTIAEMFLSFEIAKKLSDFP